MVLWSRTVSESSDLEQRRVAAYKLSQYSQRIFPSAVVATLISCVKDPDVQIKVFCTKALGKAGTSANEDAIRAALLDRFHNDKTIRNTVVRTFMARKDRGPEVQDTFLNSLKGADNEEDRLALLAYFEQFGNPSDKLVDELAKTYAKTEDSKTRRAIVKVLSEKGRGQSQLIELLSTCAVSKDTPLILLCLSALQSQAKSDKRSWEAAEKSIGSDDPDVLMATLDLMNVLPETTNTKIAGRLLEIITSTEDPEIQEKAILALGSTGDRSEPVVTALMKILEEANYDESIQIAAALSLGQQAISFPDKPKDFLKGCRQGGRTQALRTACGLASDDLDTRQQKVQTTEAKEKKEPSVGPAQAAAPSETKTP
jgi:HEAT repeat protein